MARNTTEEANATLLKRVDREVHENAAVDALIVAMTAMARFTVVPKCSSRRR
jgi:hypothetical protein